MLVLLAWRASAAKKSMQAARATREGHQSSAEPLPLSQTLMYACGLGLGDLEPVKNKRSPHTHMHSRTAYTRMRPRTYIHPTARLWAMAKSVW